MTKNNPSGDLRIISKKEIEKDTLAVKYSPNKEHVVVGCSDGVIRIFRSGSGELIQSLECTEKTEGVPITSMKFRIDPNDISLQNLLTGYSNGNIILWNYETGQVLKHIKEDRQTLGVTYHPKLPKFLTVGNNGTIHLYDEETMKLEQTFEKGINKAKAEGHSSRVFTTLFHPLQVNEFLSGGWDDTVHFWDLRQSTSLRFLRGPHICGEGIDISKTGREILTCAYTKDNPIQLWHYKSGKLMSNLEPDLHKSMLYCGHWVTPDYLIMGGTDPSLLRVVSLRSLTTVATYKGTSSLGVSTIDYYMKNTKAITLKKDIQSQDDVRFVFGIDKSIIESEISL